MNVVGLVVEYNPLHNGHIYHFQQSKEVTNADAVVIVMSGNFLQRGEPALVNKWARTKMALEMGADLIFELPYVYSTQQAHYFATGAISILHHLPFVSHLCFGSESGNIGNLQYIAKILADEPASFQQVLQQEMKKGESYPNAYSNALKELLQDQDIDPSLSEKPNNILGLHYIMALLNFKSRIQATTIKREKADYHEKEFLDEKIASATSIRQALFSSTIPDWQAIKPFLPAFTLDILEQEYKAGRGPVSWENYYPYINHSFLAQSVEHVESIYEMEEGIEHRFKQKVTEAVSMEHFCQLVKTKRYTWNRIQRMILHTYTQFTKTDASQLNLNQGVRYLRLLGFSSTGKQLLNQYKKELKLPLISSIRKNHPAMLDWDLKASVLHSLGYRANVALQAKKREVRQPPIQL